MLAKLILVMLALWLSAVPALSARYDLATLQLRQRARGIVVAAMRQEDTFVRSLAIRAVADQEDRAAFPVVQLALLAEDRAVKYLAFRTLYQLQDPAATAALALGIRSSKSIDRIQTAWMIGEMADLFRRRQDPQALAWLETGAGDADGDVRMTALEALGKLADPEALATLRHSCRDSVAEARQYAVEGLGRLGTGADLPLVLTLLHDKETEVRRQAALAMARLGERVGSSGGGGLKQALRDSDAAVRLQAAVSLQLLGLMDDRAFQQALHAADNASVKLQALDSLEPLARRALSIWRLALRDDDSEVRFRAAQLLAKLGERAGLAVLKGALTGEDWAQRLQAAESLADLGEPGMLRRMIQDPRSEVRVAALKSLSLRPERARGDREGILDALLQRLDDPQPAARARAAEAIGLLNDRTALSRLKLLFDDQHDMVRTAAAWAVLRLSK